MVIDYLRGDNNAINVINKFPYKDLYITEIVVFEVVSGISYSVKKNKVSKKRLDIFFEFLSRVKIIPTSSLFAWEAGEIGADLLDKGEKIDSGDCLIAGLMLRNNCKKIITKNVKHFSKIKGIEVISY